MGFISHQSEPAGHPRRLQGALGRLIDFSSYDPAGHYSVRMPDSPDVPQAPRKGPSIARHPLRSDELLEVPQCYAVVCAEYKLPSRLGELGAEILFETPPTNDTRARLATTTHRHVYRLAKNICMYVINMYG